MKLEPMRKLINLLHQPRYKSLVLPFIVFLLLSAVIFFGLRKQSQAFHFEDETDHVAVGWMMHRFDKKLYIDLSTNHQPFPILASAAITQIIPYTTLFELIERLRISMFLFGMLWGAVIAVRFKWPGIFAYALTFSIGYYFFAWHVLAESFVAPAALFITLLLFEKLTAKTNTLLSKQKQLFDAIFAGIAFAILISSLLPMWPFCALAGFALLFVFTNFERKYFIGTTSIVLLSMLLFFSPFGWFQETIVNNILYFLPTAPKITSGNAHLILFFPFLSFLKPQDRIAQMFLIPLLVTLLVIVFSAFKHRKITKKTIILAIYFYLLLIVTNQRVFKFPTAFYQGFHLFPFIAVFFALLTSVSWKLISLNKSKIMIGVLGLIFLGCFIFNLDWIRKDVDKLNEYYVQYGTQDSYARLISIFKKEGDTFYSGPNGFGYINMRADLPIAGRQLFHLHWAYLSPKLKAEFHQLLAENPPTFVLLYEDESGYHTDFQPVLKEKYTEMVHGKHRTMLYFLNTKMREITPTQQQYLEDQDFHFRTAAEVEIY